MGAKLSGFAESDHVIACFVSFLSHSCATWNKQVCRLKNAHIMIVQSF